MVIENSVLMLKKKFEIMLFINNSKFEKKKNNLINRKRAAMYTKTVNAFMDNISIAASEAPSDYDARKVIKYGNPYQAAWGIFSEYCNNSTIHGIRYLGEQKRPCLERYVMFFFFFFILCMLKNNFKICSKK